MNSTFVSIVEGYGEVSAVPVLVRRVLAESGIVDAAVRKPHRLARQRFRSDELVKAVAVQAVAVTGAGGVLILADADDDCPVEFSQAIRAATHSLGVSVEVVAAQREFESWFLGGIGGLRSHRSVMDDATYPGDPEAVRDAKGALSALMREAYRPTIHQPAFVAMMDLDAARERCPSFARFCRAVTALAI